jgi:hypothetical protein
MIFQKIDCKPVPLILKLAQRLFRVAKTYVSSALQLETEHFHYACRDHASGFAATAVFGANTPLFRSIDAFGAVAVVTGIRGASAC